MGKLSNLGLAIAMLAVTLVAVPAARAVPVLVGKVLDNDRVMVWDITLKLGQTGPATPPDEDAVILFLEGGKIRSDSTTGSNTMIRDFGDAVFVPKGSKIRDTLVKGGPAHEVVVWLKNVPAKTLANSTKYPLAFPRPGAVQTLDNDRVVVWHYTWLPGKPTPMHFHDKDAVVAYRYDGAVTSTAPDGTATINNAKAGEIRFNPAGRIHSELLSSARQSAAMVELK